jgi:membrane-bound lytic murein transglycosylase D
MKKTAILLCSWLILVPMGILASADTTAQDQPLRPDDPEIVAIDKMLVSGYLNHFCFSKDQAHLNAFNYAAETVPQFSGDLIAERLRVLDRDTPFDLVYNPTVQGFIDLYSVRRRELTSKVLGMSELYFPLFEEALSRHGIPLEMKYLAVVESALNPSAISPAGAGGLWQFMVSTGKMYGLNVSSYQDDRFDPIKSTEAACQYLKYLYGLYNSWELALAAYNSGPGNVNKAIRRSGGKKDFWDIKAFLPKETQGYVPAFIAVNYVMNYASEYNLYPRTPMITFFETDTVHVKQRVQFGSLAQILGMKEDDLAFLNATYKLREVPDNGRRNYLILPVDKVGLFLNNEELAYSRSTAPVPSGQSSPAPLAQAASGGSSESAQTGTPKVVYEEAWTTHKVKRGESLGKIADNYGVSLAQIKKWNHIRGSVIHPGQKLKVHRTVKKIVYEPAEQSAQADAPAPQGEAGEPVDAEALAAKKSEESVSKAPTYKYYTIQPGDTLYKIAARHQGVTVDDLKTLNSGLREHKLVVGQKLKLKQIG